MTTIKPPDPAKIAKQVDDAINTEPQIIQPSPIIDSGPIPDDESNAHLQKVTPISPNSS